LPRLRLSKSGRPLGPPVQGVSEMSCNETVIKAALREAKPRIKLAAREVCKAIERDTGIVASWDWVTDSECRICDPEGNPILSIHAETLR
jgi:hypothetical protein